MIPDSAELHIERLRGGRWLQFQSAAGYAWNRVRLPIECLPSSLEGFRIIHITDFHARANWDPAYDQLITDVRNSAVDLILFTGDFVDDRFDHRAGLPNIRRLMPALTSRLGTWAILGNHDGDLLGPALFGHNVHLIDHQQVILRDGNANLELIGIGGVDRRDLDQELLQSLSPRPDNSVRLVLAHFPDAIRHCDFLKPDAYLCGHTHGGQVCLPSGKAILSHDSLPRQFSGGIHRHHQTWMIINRGFGFSSSLQLRLFCPAEVLEIVLTRLQ